MVRISKVENSIAYLRQVCTLGLGPQLVMPWALRTLRDIIPSDHIVFLGTATVNRRAFTIGDQLVPGLWPWQTEEYAMPLPHVTGDDRSQPVAMAQFHMDTHHGNQFFNRAYDHKIIQGPDSYHCLEAVVAPGGVRKGVTLLFRLQQEPPFSDREETLLRQLNVCIANTFVRISNDNEKWVDSELKGIVALDQIGQPVYLSDLALPLLSLAADRRMSSGISLSPPLDSLLQWIVRTVSSCRRRNESSSTAFYLENVWGRFVFRGFLLQSVACVCAPHDILITVTVEHQEPLSLHIMKELKSLPLSPAQREVCLLLARRIPRNTIAERMHIRPSTVKAHVDAVYGKLGVNDRDTLIKRLLG